MFRIGEFSRLSRLSVRMLRHYDTLGLLVPALRDEVSGYRLYALDQLKRANRIRLLRDLGFGLDAIKRLVTLGDAALLDELTQRERAIQEALEDQRRQLQAVRHLAQSVAAGDETVHGEVSLVTVPACEVVSVRMMIPSYADERLAWERLGVFVKERGIASMRRMARRFWILSPILPVLTVWSVPCLLRGVRIGP